LPDDSPALEAPVPVDPDIIYNLNVCKSANGNHNFDNVSHFKCFTDNCFTDNCDGFHYISQLHDFTDGYNDFEIFDNARSKENDSCCKNVCLNSDFVQFNHKFVANDIDLDNSLAREYF
jgi:hypothetical protein